MLVHKLVPEGLGQLHLVLDLHRLLTKSVMGPQTEFLWQWLCVMSINYLSWITGTVCGFGQSPGIGTAKTLGLIRCL